MARAGIGAALAVVVIGANVTAARALDLSAIYNKFLDTIGLNDSGANINYSERSPLVVPPTRDLPPPGSAAAPPVPDWPKDPDLARAAHAKANDLPGPGYKYIDQLDRPLRPDQLNVRGPSHGPAAGGSSADTGDYSDRSYRPKGSIFSFALGWFKKKKKYATFTGAPARTSLIDPPPGYLTPSPDQPYGIGPDQQQHYKIPTVASRMTQPP